MSKLVNFFLNMPVSVFIIILLILILAIAYIVNRIKGNKEVPYSQIHDPEVKKDKRTLAGEMHQVAPDAPKDRQTELEAIHSNKKRQGKLEEFYSGDHYNARSKFIRNMTRKEHDRVVGYAVDAEKENIKQTTDNDK